MSFAPHSPAPVPASDPDDPTPLYSAFIGTWILDPSTCDYQQGAPPISALYQIEIESKSHPKREQPKGQQGERRLLFKMSWVDADGDSHHVEFSGCPNGLPFPFAGGELADAMVITTVSARELNSAALYQGQERMTAQRQLDDTKMAMRITQVVRFAGGARLANVGVYRRQVLN